MKRRVVGISSRVFHWNDKKTGEPRHAFNVFVTGKSRDAVGLKVWQLFIDDTFPAFSEVAIDIDHGRAERYIDTECSVEYNEMGYLEEIEFNLKPTNQSK